MKIIFRLVAVMSAVAVLLVGFGNVFAQNGGSEPVLSGGSTIETAGTFEESYFGKTATLERDLQDKEKMYVKLPAFRPGEGFDLSFKAAEGVKIKSDGSPEPAPGEITVGIVDRENVPYCEDELSESLDDAPEKCSVPSLSSTAPEYQLYLVITGNKSFGSQISSKASTVKVVKKEFYDSALEDDDVPNTITNALSIEPGEFTGWISSKDTSDFYKVDGISNGAKVKVTLSFERENDSTGSGDVYIKVYDAKKTKISESKEIRESEIGEVEFVVKTTASSADGLAPKTTRYIEIRQSVYREHSNHYTLSVEIEGYQSSGAGGGANVNCAGFPDVASGDNRCDAVKAVQAKGIISGTGDGKFEGLRSLNRAEMAAVILRFTGDEAFGNSDVGDLADFKDIKGQDAGKWWIGVLRKAKTLGIIQGFSDGTMRPGDPVNRAQFVVIFTRAAGITLPTANTNPANDVKISSSATSWYRNAVAYVVKEGLFDLDRNSRFNPNAAITRFEVADLLNRWFEKTESGAG